ncbi:MAG: helix-turn-helix transcriptional regulator [Actinobacteria bacterium]|nr:helix-turn-helix transcriptional regulator [Actinomycetota bacterium]
MIADPEEIAGGGLPRNFLRPCALLLLAESPNHGYELLAQLAELGLGSTDPGGLYRLLRGMEQDGLVESSWETSEAGPPRRSYEITPDGVEWLHAWGGALAESRRLVGVFLARYRALAPALPEGSPRASRT